MALKRLDFPTFGLHTRVTRASIGRNNTIRKRRIQKIDKKAILYSLRGKNSQGDRDISYSSRKITLRIESMNFPTFQ